MRIFVRVIRPSEFALRKVGIAGVILVSLVISTLNAQPQFPLAVGNAWHYTIAHVYPPPSLPPEHYTIRVVGDSLMPNGKRYWVFDKSDMFWGRFIRSDSGYISYWQYHYYDSSWSEQTLFNLQAAFGEVDTIQWQGFFEVDALGSGPGVVFGNSTQLHSYGLGGIQFAGLTFAERFGYIYYQFDGDWGTAADIWSLEGCIISDTVFGNMTNVSSSSENPRQLELFQNYPNPFNGLTRLSYVLPKTTPVRLDLYDVLGNLITELVNEVKPAGVYSVTFQPSHLASGVYYARLSTGIGVETTKLIYVK